MSDSRTPDDAGSPPVRETRGRSSKSNSNKLKASITGKETVHSSGTTPPRCNVENLQTPKRKPCSRYTCLNSCDSPGDGEVSQDIIWDPTSPNTGNGPRNIPTVEISDIVNRIAPKDVKQVATESPLLQWIGYNAIPYTPENPQPKVRKKSIRQRNVEDLMKLARQFDEMQQDEKTLEKLKTDNNICEQISGTKCAGVGHPGNTEGAKSHPSTSQRVEAELHALFDSSTQQISGRFSQSSSGFNCSQEKKGKPGGSTSTASQPSELKSVKKYTDARNSPTEHQGTSSLNVNKQDEFDDDWDDDVLLNDSFVLTMTHNSEQQQDAVPKITPQSNVRVNTNQYPSACKPSMSACAASEASSVQSQTHRSAYVDVIPKPKTSKRSTFQLESNPHFQAKVAAANDAPGLGIMEPSKSQIPDQKSAVMKPLSLIAVDTSKVSKVTSEQINRRAGSAGDSVKDCPDKVEPILDCLWDDCDDQLFYQACDNVERTYSNKKMKASPKDFQEKQHIVEGRKKAAVLSSIDTARTRNSHPSTSRRISSTIVLSNSLIETTTDTVNYQGWSIPFNGANQSTMSQGHLRSHAELGTFNHSSQSSATFQAADANLGVQTHAMNARLPQNSKSYHGSFKRYLSDPGAVSKTAFVASQTTGKCSAVEIEKKRQEALARRRLRTQSFEKQ